MCGNQRELGETFEVPLNEYGDTEKPYWDWGE